jgi:oligoribonuclease NrnB/cAMP/cGMP phosphodiesterase (DHH superfamily)
MNITTPITTIVTHANCPDGKASAIILNRFFPEARVIFLQYNSKQHLELEAKPGMLFCDFSPPRERIQDFVQAGAYVLDHHKYAKDIVEAFGDHGVYASEEERGVSGAVLAYREVIEPIFGEMEDPRRLATLAGIRDCWVKESPLWQEAAEQAAALQFFDWEYLLSKGFGVEEMELGKYLYQKTLTKAKDIVANNLLDCGKIAIMSGLETSDVADALFEINPKIDILAGFAFVIENNKSKMVVSLRSRTGVDVGCIAKRNGGGGHGQAAGFSIEAPAKQWEAISEILKRI